MMDTHFDPRIIITKDIDMRMSERQSLNRLCDISDWRNGGEICIILQSLGECVSIHRKAWEYAYCIHGLQKLGAVRPENTAIAVGAGHERPLFYFANRIERMVATDLYENWGIDGNPDMLSAPEKFAPFPYRKENLEVHQMNATDLHFEDNTFDFAFTLSSIEHFGSRKNITTAMSEMHRVLKPGGFLCLTTEFILNKSRHPEFFTLDEFRQHILESTPLKMVGGDMDLRISHSTVGNIIDLDSEKDLTISPHIVLKTGEVLFTSVLCFLQKPKI
jgi:ubiquinone/menaquinone biosynthesis C-methylase UbiE